MVTRQGHRRLPRKDTTACHLREDTTRITTREAAMREMKGDLVGLPRGVD